MSIGFNRNPQRVLSTGPIPDPTRTPNRGIANRRPRVSTSCGVDSSSGLITIVVMTLSTSFPSNKSQRSWRIHKLRAVSYNAGCALSCALENTQSNNNLPCWREVDLDDEFFLRQNAERRSYVITSVDRRHSFVVPLKNGRFDLESANSFGTPLPTHSTDTSVWRHFSYFWSEKKTVENAASDGFGSNLSGFASPIGN